MALSHEENFHDGLGRVATIILAAGKGTRMRSDLPKVLHTVCGEPMVLYPIELARSVGSEIIVLVVGHRADLIRAHFEHEDLLYVYQREQLGTGHAVLQTRESLRNFDGNILILCGDVPLLLPATVHALIELHGKSQAAVTVLTTLLEDPTGYGRVVKGTNGDIIKIVEDRDASEQEKEIREINSGIYCVESRFLYEAVAQISNENAQSEYYLTDIIEIATRMNRTARSYVIFDYHEVMGINSPQELEKANQIMADRHSI